MTRSLRPPRTVRRVLFLVVLLGGVILAADGCYYLNQAAGQMDVVLDRESSAAALRSPSYTPAQKDRIRLVREIKAFGIRALGLRDNGAYETVYDTGGKPVAWNLVACPPDSVRPRPWSFWVVGELPYVGFFDRADAEREEARCRARGDATLLRPVAAYSPLGWFGDPIFSTMLDDSEADLSELILHELTHGTVFHRDRGNFNESLATFAGQEGSLAFLAERHGPDSEAVRSARAEIDDARRFADWIRTTHADMDAYYKGSGSRVEKIAGREARFEEARRRFRAIPFATSAYRGWLDRNPLNNAIIAANRDYTAHADLFAAVAARHPEGLKGLIRLAARTEAAGDPPGFLRGWLGGQ